MGDRPQLQDHCDSGTCGYLPLKPENIQCEAELQFLLFTIGQQSAHTTAASEACCKVGVGHRRSGAVPILHPVEADVVNSLFPRRT